MKKPTEYIFYETHSTIGGSEGSKVTIVINVQDGTTQVRVDKSISEYFDIKDYDKAVDLYERLNCGSGRKMWKLEEIAHPYNPRG